MGEREKVRKRERENEGKRERGKRVNKRKKRRERQKRAPNFFPMFLPCQLFNHHERNVKWPLSPVQTIWLP